MLVVYFIFQLTSSSSLGNFSCLLKFAVSLNNARDGRNIACCIFSVEYHKSYGCETLSAILTVMLTKQNDFSGRCVLQLYIMGLVTYLFIARFIKNVCA